MVLVEEATDELFVAGPLQALEPTPTLGVRAGLPGISTV